MYLLCILPFIIPSYAVDLSSTYRLTWTTDATRITFNIEAKATGWIGLGLNTDPGMPGADIVVAGVSDGQKYIYVSNKNISFKKVYGLQF